MSCPWANINIVQTPVSLLEVTSEEIAKSIQKREVEDLENATVTGPENWSKHNTQSLKETDCDEVIAHLLQAQFSKDYNLMLKRTEEKVNRDSKVNISLSNFRTYCHDDNQEHKDMEKADMDMDPYATVEREYASIPRCGYKRIGDSSHIITKHDILMSSRINACRVLQFPPGIHTGDTARSDVKLNNKVYNSLRAHSHAQYSRSKAKTKSRSK